MKTLTSIVSGLGKALKYAVIIGILVETLQFFHDKLKAANISDDDQKQ